MEIERVEYKDGRPFIRYIHKTGKLKGYIKRDYGQIIICQECGKKSFANNNHIKEGRGKFCSFKCTGQLENNSRWRGGRKKHEGYVLIRKPDHPHKNSQGYVYEHRLVVEKQIGRYLYSYEVVHHINKIKNDNQPKNLMGFRNRSVHQNFEVGKVINDKDILIHVK